MFTHYEDMKAMKNAKIRELILKMFSQPNSSLCTGETKPNKNTKKKTKTKTNKQS